MEGYPDLDNRNREVVLHWEEERPFIWAENLAHVLRRDVDDIIYDIARLTILADDRSMVKGEIRAAQTEGPDGRRHLTYSLSQSGVALYLHSLDMYSVDADVCHRLMDKFDEALGNEWMKIPRRVVSFVKRDIFDKFFPA